MQKNTDKLSADVVKLIVYMQTGAITSLEGWWDGLVRTFNLHDVWEALLAHIGDTVCDGCGEGGNSVQAVQSWFAQLDGDGWRGFLQAFCEDYNVRNLFEELAA